MSGRLVLVRHGQSHGNVERRLDTRPPGRELTDLGREQARTFAHDWPHEIGMVAHSIAVRASQTAAEIGGELSLDPHELEGIHEVQVGDLEDRNDDAAIEEFNTIYQRWHEGELDLRMPAGESATQVLDRYVPVITQLRMRYLDDDAWHGDIIVVSHGAAIRLVAATLGGGGRKLRPRPSPAQRRIRCADADHRRPMELSALGPQGPAVLSGARRSPGRGRPVVGRPDGLSAGATDRLAVDDERVHDLGRDAAVLGALRPLQGVMDDGAVAVVESGSTPPAVAVHGPFIAPSARRSAVAALIARAVKPSRVRADGRRRCRSGGRPRG